MNKHLFYHVYLTDNDAVWSTIFLEQMNYMEDANLLDNLASFRVNIITQDDSRNNKFTGLLKEFLPSIKGRVELRWVRNPYPNDDVMLSNLEGNDTITENSMMRWMYDEAKKEDAYFCYVHTKGITAYSKQFQYADCSNFLKYYYWRQYLNWGVLERWQDCVKALDNYYDIAGVNFENEPAPHFSGNFWWATSKHLRNLPDPATKDWWYKLKENTNNQWLKSAPDRYRDEQWPCSRIDTLASNMHDLKDNLNPAYKILKRKDYDPIK